HDLAAEPSPDAALAVIARGEDHRQVELGDYHEHLTTVAGRRVATELAAAGPQRGEVPRVAVIGFAIELAEARGIDAGGRGGDVRVRRGRDPHPRRVHDAMPLPDSAVEVELSDLEEVARSQVRTSPEIPLAVGHQIPVIPSELERPRHGPLEQL